MTITLPAWLLFFIAAALLSEVVSLAVNIRIGFMFREIAGRLNDLNQEEPGQSFERPPSEPQFDPSDLDAFQVRCLKCRCLNGVPPPFLNGAYTCDCECHAEYLS